MAKKMISRLSVLSLLIVLLAACSKTSEYVNVIPADATFVVSMNLKILAEKAGLNDKENEAMKQKLTETLKSGASATAFQQLERVLKNPNESGFDFGAPLYFFTSPSFPYNAIVGKTSGIDQVTASLEALMKEQLCQPIQEGDGYSYSLIGSKDMIIFNEQAVMLVSTSGASQIEEAKKTITTLLKQTTDESIGKNVGFQKIQSQKGDINFFASLEAIPDLFAGHIKTGFPPNIALKEVITLGSISFEKGKVAIRFETYSENKETTALLKKQNKALNKLNNSSLKQFPASTLCFLTLGVDGEALYDNLLENEEFRNNQTIAKAAEIKNLFGTFNGDISVGLLNVDIMKQSPAFLAYADVKNGDALKAIYTNKQKLGLKSGEDIVQLSENEYVYKSRNLNVFFGVKEKQMYATNDEIMYKSIGNSVDKSIKDTNFASNIKGKSVYFAINMETILELPVTKMVMGFGGNEAKMYFNMASKISYLETGVEGEVGEMNLVLKDKDTNALKQIVDFSKQFVGM